MTLVIACITKYKKILIRSDSRVIDDNGDIVSERSNKIIKINERCCLAFAGYIDVGNELLAHLYETYSDRSIWRPKMIFDEAVTFRNANPSKHILEVLFAGFDEEDNPVLYDIRSAIRTIGSCNTEFGCVVLGDHNVRVNYDPNEDEMELRQRLEKLILDTAQSNKTVNTRLSITDMALSSNINKFLKGKQSPE